MSFCVYVLTNTANGKRYVGKASSFRDRMYGHKTSPNCGVPTAIARAIGKYGWDSFTKEIVAEFEVEADALAHEIRTIAEWGTMVPSGYNITAGGEGTSGRHKTDEEREHLSAVVTEKWQDDEHRAKRIAAIVDAMMSVEPEVRSERSRRGAAKGIATKIANGIPLSKAGWHHTPETRAKMSATRTGRHQPNRLKGKLQPLRAHHRAIEFNGETMKLRDWARRTGLSSVTISDRLKRGWSVEDALTRPLRGADK